MLSSLNPSLDLALGITCLVFIGSACQRAWSLYRVPLKVDDDLFGRFKNYSNIAYAAAQCLVTVEHAVSYASFPHVAGIQAFKALASVVLVRLSYIEHQKTVRPSTLIATYLSVIAALDVIEILRYDTAGLRIFNLCLTLILLTIECRNKRSSLKPEWRSLPPYALAGTIDRLLFAWTNPILLEARRRMGIRAPELDQCLAGTPISGRATDAWRARTPGRYALIRVLLSTLLWDVLAPVPSRLVSIACTYAQPAIIARSINLVNETRQSSGRDSSTLEIGVWALFVYLGMALSESGYQHRIDRLEILSRGFLLGLIHEKTLTVHSGVGRPNDGRAFALATIDAEELIAIPEMIHETWAQVVEVCIGMTTLIYTVGFIAPVLLIGIFACSRVSRFVAKQLPPKQKIWNTTTQTRLATTSSFLATFKSAAMTGSLPLMVDALGRLRQDEITASKQVRWIKVAYNASANALGIFSPMLVVILFALLGRNRSYGTSKDVFDTASAFATMALLAMITHPANMLMTIYPRVIAAMTNVERVENYLREPDYAINRYDGSSNQEEVHVPSILLERASFEAVPGGPTVLSEISLRLEPSLVVCVGSVGSGKTNLLKAILGEFHWSHGSFTSTCRTIGVCEQSPWLPDVTLQEAVIGMHGLPRRTKWYDEVISACCLDADIRSLAAGDQTRIGDRGYKLSGGQRQRLALARAIYARADLLVLDDPFSAVDGATTAAIMEKLFGAEGLLRHSGMPIVVMTTTRVQHCRMSDHAVIMESLRIKAQGHWTTLGDAVGDQAHVEKLKDVLSPPVGSAEDTVSESMITEEAAKTATAELGLQRDVGDLSTYKYYFASTGTANIILLVSFTAAYAVFLIAPQYWLKLWAEDRSHDDFHATVYFLLSTLAWLATNGTMWTTQLRIAPVSGTALHSRLLACVAGAPLPYFLNADINSLMNRFSQDIRVVDHQLAPALQTVVVQVLKLATQGLLMAVTNLAMASSIPAALIVIQFTQTFYLRASKQLRLLDLEARSLVGASFIQASEGRTTIRAFGWHDDAATQASDALDASQRPLFMLLCVQRWLQVVFDFFIAVITIGTILLVTRTRLFTNGAQVGIILNVLIMSHSTLLRMVKSWTSLETCLGAVSRLKEFEAQIIQETEQGKGIERMFHDDLCPPTEWPPKGEVKLDDVQVSYLSGKPALRNMTLHIHAGQRVIVHGRTGSGKSTLLLTLLRLLELDQGSITIDGLDISRIPPAIVQQRCFITIPQDPLLCYEETLAFNMDPAGKCFDDDIVFALRAAKLWTVFEKSSPNADGSDTAVTSNKTILLKRLSSFLSLTPGQIQLFSIARAILRVRSRTSTSLTSRPIVLLDEPTASLDARSEEIFYELLHEHFAQQGHSIVIIAHKLEAAKRFCREGVDAIVELSMGAMLSKDIVAKRDLERQHVK